MSNRLDRYQYQLIDGAFSAEEAQEVLINLIDSKIGFHERKELSQIERLGKTESAVGSRINQLRQTKKELSQMLERAIENGQSFSINCSIELTAQSEAP